MRIPEWNMVRRTQKNEQKHKSAHLGFMPKPHPGSSDSITQLLNIQCLFRQHTEDAGLCTRMCLEPRALRSWRIATLGLPKKHLILLGFLRDPFGFKNHRVKGVHYYQSTPCCVHTRYVLKNNTYFRKQFKPERIRFFSSSTLLSVSHHRDSNRIGSRYQRNVSGS